MKKKFISTKVIIIAITSLIISIGCFIAAIIVIFNSDCTLATELKNHNFSILDDFGVDINIDFDNNFNDERSMLIDDNMSNITITSTAADIQVEFTDSVSSEIKMTTEGYFRSTKSFEDIIDTFEYSNNTAIIATKENSLSFRSFTLKIYIPSQYKNNITINTVSGDIDCSNKVSLDSFNLKSTSGDIDIIDIASKNASLSVTSGDISINNCSAENSTLSTISGDIEILDSKLGDTKLNSTSGDIDISILELGKSTDVKSTSGNVYLDIPSTENYKVKYSSLSGDLSGDSSHGTGEKVINVSTTSGDLDINNN